MSSWSPNDFVTDQDLKAYERTILTQFGEIDWPAKRQKAIEDWLFPLMASSGFNPHRLRTRHQPASVFGSTSSVFTDYTSQAKSQTADDIPLATILASATDALYVGAPWQFRGLSMRMLDAVSAQQRILTVEAWCDRWVNLAVTNGTEATDGVPFSKGGAITWMVPEDWVVRPVNNSSPYFWVRLRIDGVPTGAACGQVSVIRRSALAAAATLRTLYYIFREAPIAQDGPWDRKAEQYEQESQHAWERVLPLLGGEFDTVTVDDVIDQDEAAQTTDAVSGGGWSWERC